MSTAVLELVNLTTRSVFEFAKDFDTNMKTIKTLLEIIIERVEDAFNGVPKSGEQKKEVVMKVFNDVVDKNKTSAEYAHISKFAKEVAPDYVDAVVKGSKGLVRVNSSKKPMVGRGPVAIKHGGGKKSKSRCLWW